MASTPTGRSRLRRVAIGLVASWALYVAGFEAAVRTGVAEQLINRRPHRFAVRFESAHSWFPFRATAAGVEARGQLPALRWRAEVDRASGWLVPWALLDRRLRIVGARAEGIELHALKETALGETTGEPEPASLPPALGIDPAHRPAIPPLAAPPPGPPPTPRWTVEIAGFEATGVREIWAERHRLSLAARASGTLALHLPTREIEVAECRADFTSGSLRVGELEIADGLAGSARLAVSRYPYREIRGLAALAHLSGDVQFLGRVSGGRFWFASLPPQEWLALDDGLAEASGRILVREGELQPGTRVEFTQEGYGARVFDFHVQGDVRGSFEVRSDADGALAEGRAGFHDYTIRRARLERPDLVGTGLTAVATTRDLQLAGLARLRAQAKVDLGEARVPDLATVADLLPPSAGIVLAGGSGRAGGSFDLTLPELSGRGPMWIDLDDVEVRYGGLDLHGRMRLDLALATPDLPEGRFDLSGSSFALSEFESPQLAGGEPAAAGQGEAGWWARIELPEGEIDLPPAPAARGRLRVRLRDSVPFIGLFETRRRLPKWVERFLTVHDLQAESGFAYRDEELTLDEFTMPFKKFRIRARTRFGPEHKTGILLVSWRKLDLGVRFDDDRRRLKIVGVRDWYAAQTLDLSTAPVTVDPDEIFSADALAMVPFAGIEAAPVALADAEVDAEESGAAAPPFAIVPGSLARGDLDGDGHEEAALLLERSAEAGGPAFYLAALDEREGRAENVATLALGPRSAPGRLRIEAEMVVLEPSSAEPASVPPAGTPAPAPLPSTPERWRLGGSAFVQVPPSAPAPAP